jgi:tRNA pseudouridine(55) synthase
MTDSFSGVLNLYKRPGETPLERLQRFRNAHPEYRDVPMTYAGRLDPLAEGVLLVLAGEERFRRDAYLKLPKQYRFEVLWGFATDTGDLLGLVTKSAQSAPDEAAVAAVFSNFLGKILQPYPAYSSHPFEGKPLHARAREGTLPEKNWPMKEVEVYDIAMLGYSRISYEALRAAAEAAVSGVGGDFRQEKILARWREELLGEGSCSVSAVRVRCSSGTYVRGLVQSAGERLGILALALRIVRETAGEWSIETAER